MPIEPLDRKPITARRCVYRFVHTANPNDPSLLVEFRSDRVAGKSPGRREKEHPELQDGMSTYGSLGAARARWAMIEKAARKRGQPVRIGDYVAEVELLPGQGFFVEDLHRPDEHLTTWGDPAGLASAVARIYPAATEND